MSVVKGKSLVSLKVITLTGRIYSTTKGLSEASSIHLSTTKKENFLAE
jgi:hypothetical protein